MILPKILIASIPAMLSGSSAGAAESEPQHELKTSSCQKVWSGTPGRIRLYDQPTSTGRKVFLYLGSGSTLDYVGWSDRENMFTVFLSALNQHGITGYTNSSCEIEWIDYRAQ